MSGAGNQSQYICALFLVTVISLLGTQREVILFFLDSKRKMTPKFVLSYAVCRLFPTKTKLQETTTTHVGSVMIGMVYGTAAMMPTVAETRKIVYAVAANVAMLQLLLGSLLIYGVFGKKPRLILPWLIFNWILCIALIGLSVFGIILIVLQYTTDEETVEVSTISSVYGSYALIIYYFSSVVYGRREELLHDDVSESAQGLMRRDFSKTYPD